MLLKVDFDGGRSMLLEVDFDGGRSTLLDVDFDGGRLTLLDVDVEGRRSTLVDVDVEEGETSWGKNEVKGRPVRMDSLAISWASFHCEREDLPFATPSPRSIAFFANSSNALSTFLTSFIGCSSSHL